jgi:transcriptional regulator GlxA family with amidase domain
VVATSGPRVVCPGGKTGGVSRAVEERNRRLLRARDAMDRDFAGELDVGMLAAIACVSEANFIRSFKAAFGETPHRYLQRRRIERAMYLLRTSDRSVTDVCMSVGFSSLGSFSRTFADIVGQSPSAFRAGAPLVDVPAHVVPSCFVRAWTRPAG